MAMSQGSKKRFYCGHCNEYLYKTVYFQRKRLHFNKDTNEWLKEARVFQSNKTSQLSLCPSPQLQPSSSASMVTSKSSSCQRSGNSAASLTDSEEDDGRLYDDEVQL